MQCMNKEKAEPSQKYCECEYIKQTDADIVDLFRAPVRIPIDKTPRMMYSRLERKFLVVFPTGDEDLKVSRSNCPKCFEEILELQDVEPSSALVAKQEVPAWVRK